MQSTDVVANALAAVDAEDPVPARARRKQPAPRTIERIAIIVMTTTRTAILEIPSFEAVCAETAMPIISGACGEILTGTTGGAGGVEGGVEGGSEGGGFGQGDGDGASGGEPGGGIAGNGMAEPQTTNAVR